MSHFLSFLLKFNNYWALQRLQQKALADPENLDCQERMGDILYKLGRKEEALRVYRRTSQRYAEQDLLNRAAILNRFVLDLGNASQQKPRGQVASAIRKSQQRTAKRMDR